MENDPRVIHFKKRLKNESACHYCGKPMVLIKATFKANLNKVSGLIGCIDCEEVSNATFVFAD